MLLHGLGGTWRLWRPTMERLVEQFRLVAVDLPGFGRSPALPGHVFPLDEVAGRVEAVVDAFGIGEHALAGHSMGGGVSIVYAAERPQRVRRLTLVAPAGLLTGNWARPSWRSPFLHRLGREATRLAEPALLISAGLRRRAFGRLVAHPETLARRDALALVRGSRAGRGTGPAGITIVSAGLGERLHELTMPTLVVFGGSDRVISPERGPQVLAALPDGRLLVLPDTGHLPMMERPGELAAALIEFAGDGPHASST